jgi:tight adherence protein B
MFASVLALCFSIVWAGTRKKNQTRSLKLRLEEIRDSAKNSTTGAPLLDLTESEAPRILTGLGEFVSRYGFGKNLARLLLHADSSATVGGVLLVSLGAGCGGGLIALLFLPLPLIDLAVLVVCAAMPTLFLRLKRARRLNKFGVAMPDAIDLMARSLRAGHSIGAALEMVAEQSPEPLGGEFARVFQQQRFGLRFRDALLEMADRVPSADLHFLVTAILVQRETGGDLTDILDRTTHVIRERVRIEGEVQTYTAQGRLTGWILSLLPVVLLLLINLISPGYSRMLFTDPTGQKMLYVGGGLIIFGAFLISRIVDIKV